MRYRWGAKEQNSYELIDKKHMEKNKINWYNSIIVTNSKVYKVLMIK